MVRAAELAKGCHLFTRWKPGSITNGQQILGSCQKIVVDENDEPIPGFADQLPDTSAIKPDLVVCLNPTENYVLLHECGQHNIPTIGIIDTDANASWVTYPIPANDDSLRSVQVICGALGRAGEEGQAIRRRQAKRNVVVSMPSHGLQAPKEGQVEREMEAKQLEAAQKQEDDQLWARIAQEVPGRVTEQNVSQQLEMTEGALEDLEAVSGDVEAARHDMDTAPTAEDLREDPMMNLVDSTDFDTPINQQPSEVESLPYERDRPLNEAELTEASTADEGLEDFGGELDARDEPEYFGGIRDEDDPK